MDILEHFSAIKDPRTIQKNVKYPFKEILFLVFCAAIANCKDWEEMEIWGKARVEWFRKYLPYENGIASYHTIMRVFEMLDPQKTEAVFNQMMAQLRLNMPEGSVPQQIAMDGKRLRGAKNSTHVLHIVSCYAVETGMIISQCSSKEEGKEIPQMKSLLECMNIENQLISIDGVASNKEFSEIISKKKPTTSCQSKEIKPS